ncbi:amino acid ABC transporter ATP-binding protein [Candidatus Bipolaricaulota bacterium]|nr:amino acid ABC transporter ATP-binding protein [Candidatus Bipolaricaulota bacterium]
MSALLRVENLRKCYGDEQVLQSVSFSLDRGETKVVVGPSGTGKSTLLHCINQLTLPDAGTVWLADEEITRHGTSLDRIRARIGFVFQSFNLFAHLTALGNVRLGPMWVKRIGKPEATQLALRELARVGLESKADSYPFELSGGQQQRVSIARALAMNPELILFDEPTSALDPELIGDVLNVMLELSSNRMTMLVVSHEMGFARAVADEILFMAGGRIVEQGSPDLLLDAPQNPRTRSFLARLSVLEGAHQ